MGLTELPEIKLARKIFIKHLLQIPFELDKLVKEYAKLIYKPIPITGVDGVSLNLKVPGKSPTIIVNSNLPRTRQLFTLAHELGHIIIPWHLGTIIDEIYTQSYKDFIYSQIEQEANRFAAELLMPKDWVLESFKKAKDDLAILHKNIASESGVSDHAATIRLIETLPPNIIYAAEENGKVIHSGSTPRTNALPQQIGNQLSTKLYPYTDSYTTYRKGSIVYHWWKLGTRIQINAQDSRTWREILNDIAQDIQPEKGIDQFKKSINGIMASAHGKTKREEEYSRESVIIACFYKLRRPELDDFVSHPDFEKFVKIRVDDFFKS